MKVLLLFFTAVFILFLSPLGSDGDFFHHINTGKYILESGKLPHQDTWTYTANGKQWVGHSWGMGLLYFLIYSNFGPFSVSLFVALTGFLTTFLLWAFLKNLQIRNNLTLVCTLFAAVVASIRFPARPEIITYPMILALMLIDQLKNKYQKLNLFFPVIILAWANLYGSSVFLGLTIIMLLTIKQFLADQFRFKSASRFFLIFSVISFPISLLNGYGFSTLFYPLQIQKIAPLQGEWAGIFSILLTSPLDYLITIQYRILIFFLFFIFFTGVLIFSVRRFLKYKFLLLLSTAIFIPFFSFRHAPLAAILATPLLAKLLQDLPILKKRFFIILITVTTLVSYLISFWVNGPKIDFKKTPFSPEIIRFAKANNLSGKAFNNQHIGAYLTYNLFPDILVYVDTRDDLFIETSVFKDFFDTFANNKSLIPLLEKYSSDLVIADFITGGLPYKALFYSKDWAVVFLDDHYLVAVPKSKALEKNLDILDAIDPFSESGAKIGRETEAELQYRRILAQHDLENNRFFLAKILLANGKTDAAIKILSGISIKTNPEAVVFELNKNYLLLRAYLAKKDCEKAKLYLNKTSDGTKGKFIFSPAKIFPTNIELGFISFKLVCNH